MAHVHNVWSLRTLWFPGSLALGIIITISQVVRGLMVISLTW